MEPTPQAARACSAVDQCHVAGVCDPFTGTCSNPAKPDGTTCNDGNACTLTDTCRAGACTGSSPVTCYALDQCHDAGTCDPASGSCSNPAKPDGFACDDGDACTRTDTCQAGACAGTNPVACYALDQCHDVGLCDTFTGLCSNPMMPNGTTCNDRNACTQTDTCRAGGCVGASPVICVALDACHDAGVCDPASGVCSSSPTAAGASCSDGNACNGVETCNGAGVCLAGTPPVVDDGNPCTIDSCDPVLGVVHTPAPAGTSCSDGNVCNGLETCNGAGVCVAGTPPSIDDGNPCTADSCIPSVGVVHSPIPGCGVLPPDPATVAPPTDPTVATDIASATAFLYSGSNPIQTGVAEGTIEARRVAVIRGQVKGRDGNPIGGVTITILGHQEFGQTLTRIDGMFDMAVNGGGLLTVNYQKDGYLPAQRQVQTPWRDYVRADDVVLVPYDTFISAVALGASVTQVARGSSVTDADGTRQATILFPPGTQGAMVMPDGTAQPLLSAIHVRATEYTVGPDGPKAMPAALPPTSGYTYAVELSVDEAVMAGATSVQFDRPVAFYVENFLGFAVGGIVPVGYYDRTKGVWVPSDNGKVVQIVSITGGLADLDTNGDGVADDVATLAALGVTDEERARLAATYSVATTLWRVPITHFSPWDCNWPYGCEGDCPAPNPDPPTPPDPTPNPDCDSGSIIDCQNQGLGEAAEVTGTPYTLHYSSIRVPGNVAARTVTIPASGATVPSNVIGIEIRIEIAGRTIRQSLPALPYQKYVFTWDGKDAYGRPVQGGATATTMVGWVYRAVYLEPSARGGSRSFAAMSSGSGGGGVFVPIPTRAEGMPFWRTQTWTVTLGFWDAGALGPSGWSLDVHHAYDVVRRRLLLGDGSQRSAQAFGSSVITTAAGSGATCGVGYGGYSGDGGPATKASISNPWGVAVGADGAILIADTNNNRIRRVGPDGIITTVAGSGVYGYSGDGGPATAARLFGPQGVAVGADGAIFIADTSNYRIRRVGPDGIITTVAGSNNWGCNGDGGPATAACLAPYAVAVGADGAIFIADWSKNGIRRVGPDGIITTVAGTGVYGFSGDGGPATAASVSEPWGMAVGPGGALFIADYANRRIRRVGPDGIITTVAGTGAYGYSADGGPATSAMFSDPVGVAVGADGALYIADRCNNRIRVVSPPLPGLSAGELLVASEDGGEVFVFNPSGRHMRTLDARTGVQRYIFGYDTNGQLASVTDVAGSVTAIERTGVTGTVIVAPHGQRTGLTVDGNGYLATITNPAGDSRSYSYDANGLMQTFTDPRGNVHTFQYDNRGRLIRDQNPAGGSKQLSRTERADGYSVTVTTALGRTTLHDVKRLGTGDEVRTLTQPDGTATVSTQYTNGTKNVARPDGTIWSATSGPDPRFGMQSPVVSTTTRTPLGVSLSMVESRTAVLSNPVDPLSATSLGETVVLNGRTYSTTYTATTRASTSTTPARRTSTSVLNAQGKLSQLQPPGVQAMSFSYDTSGRLSTMTQGTRTYTIGYDAQGYPQTIADPLSRTVSFTYDLAGRVRTQTLPGSRAVGFGYDASGNLISLTPPGRPAHGFGYTPVDLTSSYTPPTVTGGGGTGYSYDLDGALSQVLLPDQSSIVPGYDAAGRLSSVTTSRGTTALGYDTAGRVQTVTAPAGGVTYAYDGFLKTSEAWSGTIAGTASWTYDNDFRVATASVNGSAVSYQYDADSLLTGAGALSIAREAATGRISGTTLGAVATSQGYSEYGELASFGATASGSSTYSYSFTRDLAGRITGKTETLQGVTDSYVYGYDDAGRLATVQKNGQQTASYVYDQNGNRLQKSSGAGTEVGSYDDQDRMYAYGNASYTYRPNGELAAKTVAGQVTSYDYDALGNLRGVVLPDGRSIEYVIDGQNRRIGKKVNGQLVEGFLYDGQLRPLAWLDGTGALKARFVYGTRVNVPEYMVVGTSTYRILADHLGSPKLVIDTSSGAVVQRVDYDEWGQVLNDSNPGFQPFGFAGGLYDRDTGLVRFGRRDYDSQVGRWTNKDPIRFAGGTTNLYEYVGNDPVNYADPGGLLPAWLKAVVLAFQSYFHSRYPPYPPYQPPPPSCPVTGPPPPPPPPPPWEFPLYPWIMLDPSLYPPGVGGPPNPYQGA